MVLGCFKVSLIWENCIEKNYIKLILVEPENNVEFIRASYYFSNQNGDTNEIHPKKVFIQS